MDCWVRLGRKAATEHLFTNSATISTAPESVFLSPNQPYLQSIPANEEGSLLQLCSYLLY